MHIDIVSDVVCPWCFIGKRQLESALAQWTARHADQPAPTVRWLPFELNPDMPPEGITRQDYVTAKFGASRAKEVYARVTGVGASHGIAFDFDRIPRQPNTLAAHSLITAAGEMAAGEVAPGKASAGNAQPGIDGLQSRVKDAFLRGFFLEGADLADRATLLRIATGAGLPQDVAEHVLDDATAREAVARSEERMRAMGVSGVPFFIFENRLAVSGAQGAEALLGAMEQAAQADGRG